jgi:hypothetical protein
VAVVRASALLAALALGCASGPGSDRVGGGPDTDPGKDPELMTTPTCGTTIVPTHHVPPNLLVVLDRSCSKLDVIDGRSKWDLAVTAVNELTKTFAGRLRFGLSMFPAAGAPSCGSQGTLLVPVSMGTASTIPSVLMASLNPMDPNHPTAGPCISDIGSGLIGASTDPVLSNASEKSYLLLVTDGEQGGCETHADGILQVLSTIKALAKNGIHTLVAGFGQDGDMPALSTFANAGGLAGSGQAFYDVADRRSLTEAIGRIAAPAITCTFALDSVPRDASQVYVFVDTIFQPNDPTHASGSDYDAASNSITLYGQACAEVKAGTVKRVDAVYGCSQHSK